MSDHIEIGLGGKRYSIQELAVERVQLINERDSLQREVFELREKYGRLEPVSGEAFYRVEAERDRWRTLAEGLAEAASILLHVNGCCCARNQGEKCSRCVLKDALTAYEAAVKGTTPAPTHGETQKEPK